MILTNAGSSRRRQRDRLAAALRDTGLALTPSPRRGDRFADSPAERETLLRSAQVFATLAAAPAAQS